MERFTAEIDGVIHVMARATGVRDMVEDGRTTRTHKEPTHCGLLVVPGPLGSRAPNCIACIALENEMTVEEVEQEMVRRYANGQSASEIGRRLFPQHKGNPDLLRIKVTKILKRKGVQLKTPRDRSEAASKRRKVGSIRPVQASDGHVLHAARGRAGLYSVIWGGNPWPDGFVVKTVCGLKLTQGVLKFGDPNCVQCIAIQNAGTLNSDD